MDTNIEFTITNHAMAMSGRRAFEFAQQLRELAEQIEADAIDSHVSDDQGELFVANDGTFALV